VKESRLRMHRDARSCDKGRKQATSAQRISVYPSHFEIPEPFVGFSLNIACEIKSSRYSDWLLAGRPRGRSSSPSRATIFVLFLSSSQALGPAQPPIQCVPRALSHEVKRPGRDADRSPPISAEFKNTRIYTFTPQYAYME
jgi:hypothetical protein